MKHTIKNNFLTVKIDTLGAEIVSVKGQREFIWQNTSTEGWHGHAPNLFPVCGRCAITVGGKTYSEILHGFAKKFRFSVVDKGEDFISFNLTSNEETFKLYPFNFSFTLTYTLVENTLKLNYLVKNIGTEELYFSYGGHESFNLEKGKDFFIKFPKEEKFILLGADNHGRLNGKVEDRGCGKLFKLEEKDLANDETIIIETINSETVTICDEEGVEYYTSDFPGIRHLLFWKAGEDSICVEPWYNLPDNSGERKELSEKQMIRLPAGKTFTAERLLHYKK